MPRRVLDKPKLPNNVAPDAIKYISDRLNENIDKKSAAFFLSLSDESNPLVIDMWNSIAAVFPAKQKKVIISAAVAHQDYHEARKEAREISQLLKDIEKTATRLSSKIKQFQRMKYYSTPFEFIRMDELMRVAKNSCDKNKDKVWNKRKNEILGEQFRLVDMQSPEVTEHVEYVWGFAPNVIDVCNTLSTTARDLKPSINSNALQAAMSKKGKNSCTDFIRGFARQLEMNDIVPSPEIIRIIADVTNVIFNLEGGYDNDKVRKALNKSAATKIKKK
jgi:hypothetical protein